MHAEIRDVGCMRGYLCDEIHMFDLLLGHFNLGLPSGDVMIVWHLDME